MTRIMIVICLLISLVVSGFVIAHQRDQMSDLNSRMQIIQTSRETEQKHFIREIDRLGQLENMQALIGDLNVQAENDSSDAGSMFSASRLQRLNQVR
ncbi:hypothetical protein [Cereibacter changlensis]|uniref:hypothetical protein n=1 Tax=Cereibacter changlensis TaxID=402884 RepID=UPI0040345998